MPHRRPTSRHRGSILIIVMTALIVLAGMALVMARAARVEAFASANHDAQLRADAIAQGVIRVLQTQLDQTAGVLPADGVISAEAVAVGDGYYWIIRHQSTDDRNAMFGITDEVGKINLNSATIDMFERLPGMTSDLAAGIVDWRDADSEPTAGGAESQYYLLQPDPYNAKNAPLETVDELLLVKDFTPAILLGEDTNRNSMLDANEDDTDASEPPDNRDGKLDRGVVDFVTVYGGEPNTSTDGQRRTNVNTAGDGRLTNLLSAAASGDRLSALVAATRTNRPYRSVLEFFVRSGMTADEFGKVSDNVTTIDAAVLQPAVNVNSAPREVLLCLPGLDASDVDAILSRRARGDGTSLSIATLAEILPREKALALGPTVTSKSYFCSADIVAVDGRGRSFKRLQVVFDTRSSPVRVAFCRDLTPLGWPLDAGILDGLRLGLAPAAGVSQSPSNAGGNQR